MTQPSVIVATETDATVRLYVGHPSNGGMNQTAQFASAKPIDPHDLADIAVSLSTQFGWLELAAEPERAPTPAALPAATTPNLHGRFADRIACPVKGCGFISPRKNMASHLMTRKHNWKREDANRAARMAQAIPVDGDAKVAAILGLPEPKPNSATLRKRDGKAARVGVAGKRELESVIFPKLLKWMGAHGREVNSREVGKHFDETANTAKAWLNKLAVRGDVVLVNPGMPAGVPHRYALAQRESEPVTSPVVQHFAAPPIPNESESVHV